MVSLVGFGLPALALDSSKTLTQYAHRVWGQEEGLFQPTIYSILQTRDGFLWLGTQDSLIRFDGMHFREFRDGNSVFHRTLIHALFEDRAGNLWVGSLGSGVARIDPNGSVHRYTAKDGLPSPNTFCLTSDSDEAASLREPKTQASAGAIWVCTDRGLARISSHGIQTFTHAQGLPSDHVRATCDATDGTRWVAGLDFGLSRWTGSRFETYTDNVVAAADQFSALLCSQDGSVWAGGKGLVHITRHGSTRFTTRDGLPDNQISSLAEARDGSVWAGSDDGISRLRNDKVSVYRTRDGLSHSVVLSLYVDREGSLWAGTKDGLDQFTDGNVTPYTTNEGLLSNDSGPVVEDARGRLWIGSLGSGLNWFDGHQFGAITTRNGLIGDKILSLARDTNDDLWVGTANGISRLRDGHPVQSYTTADGLSGREVRALFVDNEGTLWAGTENGLDRFDGRRFRRADFVPQANAGVVALAGGRTVRLFASIASPALYLLRNDHPAGYHFDISHPVDCYYLDHVRHSVWMGTLGSGLLRWKDGVITHVRVKDGLYDNRIYAILNDDHANFWLASSKGIFRVSMQELEAFADGKARYVTSIPFSTGQLRFECRSGVQPAAWRAHDGRLWFSTTNGLVMVDPNHLRTDNIPPPVAITAVLVNGQRIETQGQPVLKPWDKNNVEIRYAGLSFVSPEKVTFRYRLEGFDRDWTDAGTRREAFFTNLPPGQFRFVVMARNADGIWSKQTGALSLEVEPLLYQRWWFFPALAALLGLAAAAWYRLRIRRLKQRFELVLAERNRIARELHDTLLQGLAGITMQMQALWTRLPVSNERTFLAGIIQDAGHCATEARQSLWGLRTLGPGSFEFSENLKNMAKRAVRGTPVSLALNIDRVSLRAMPEIEFQLLRIAHEVISNVVKHANAFLLRIDLALRDGVLLLTLQDDGVGFDASAGGQPGHFGLVGMRERAEQIGAEFILETSPAGTKISVSLALTCAKTPESNAGRVPEHQTV